MFYNYNNIKKKSKPLIFSKFVQKYTLSEWQLQDKSAKAFVQNFQTVFFIAKHEAKPFITASKEAEGHNPGIFNQQMIKIICFKTYM